MARTDSSHISMKATYQKNLPNWNFDDDIPMD
jgi:hypothetical protein